MHQWGRRLGMSPGWMRPSLPGSQPKSPKARGDAARFSLHCSNAALTWLPPLLRSRARPSAIRHCNDVNPERCPAFAGVARVSDGNTHNWLLSDFHQAVRGPIPADVGPASGIAVVIDTRNRADIGTGMLILEIGRVPGRRRQRQQVILRVWDTDREGE